MSLKEKLHMEIRSVNDQSDMSAAGVISSMILPRAAKIEALKRSPNNEFDSPRQSPSAEPTPERKRERLVLSLKRYDGSEVLSVYA